VPIRTVHIHAQLRVAPLLILISEKPIQYLLESFKADHEGDEIVARCLIVPFASQSVVNSNGTDVLATAESGKGKYHAFETMLEHVTEEFRLGGRIFDKALFYDEALTASSAICLDDVGLSEQMQETLRGVTTSFKKPFLSLLSKQGIAHRITFCNKMRISR